MAHLPHRGQLAVEFLAKLADQFALGPGQPVIVKRYRQQVLFDPAVALDLFRITAVAAVPFGCENGGAKLDHGSAAMLAVRAA